MRAGVERNEGERLLRGEGRSLGLLAGGKPGRACRAAAGRAAVQPVNTHSPGVRFSPPPVGVRLALPAFRRSCVYRGFVEVPVHRQTQGLPTFASRVTLSRASRQRRGLGWRRARKGRYGHWAWSARRGRLHDARELGRSDRPRQRGSGSAWRALCRHCARPFSGGSSRKALAPSGRRRPRSRSGSWESVAVAHPWRLLRPAKVRRGYQGGCSSTRARARCACRSSRIRPAASTRRLPQSRQRRAAAMAGHNAGPSRATRCAPLARCRAVAALVSQECCKSDASFGSRG